MAMVVKNNMSAVSTLNTLNKNSSALQKSLSKVSSGMKINSAQDDASGYAISERMRVQIRSLDQANQNTQNGSSMMKTAEGAVSSTVEILKSLKEKAINAANDTNKDSDRTTIQKEIDQFIDQIDDNALTTFNGKYLVDGSKAQEGQAVATSMTNQSLQIGTKGTTALTALNNRNNESLEINETDSVTASYVMNGHTYTTKYEVGKTTLNDVFKKLNDVKGPEASSSAKATEATKSKEELLEDVTKAMKTIKDAVATTGAYGKDAANGAAVDAYLDAAVTPDAYGEMPGLTADFDASTVTGWVTNDTTGADAAAKLANDSTEINNAITADMKTALSEAISAYNAVAADTEKKAAAETLQNADEADIKAVMNATTADGAATLTDAQKKIGAAINALGATDATKLVTDAKDKLVSDIASSIMTNAGTQTELAVGFQGEADNTAATFVTKAAGGSAFTQAEADAVANDVLTAAEAITDANLDNIKDAKIGFGTNTNNAKTAASASGTPADTVSTADYKKARLLEDAITTATTLGADAYKAVDDDAGADEGVAGAGFDTTTGVKTSTNIGKSAFGDAVDTADGTEGLTISAANKGMGGQISGLTISITDSEGNVKKSANAALDDFQTTIFAKNASAPNELTFQVGAAANQAITVGLEDMRSEALGLKGRDGHTKVSVATQDKANAAVAVFDNAIAKALDQQTTIGAIEARLEYTSQNLTTSSENVQAAESTIRDADMAKEMTNYTKNNVLLQAAQSMLAQANQSSSAVLSLLQ